MSIKNPTLTAEQFEALLSAPENVTNSLPVLKMGGRRKSDATDRLKFQLYRSAAVALTAIAIYGVGVQKGESSALAKAIKASATIPATTTTPTTQAAASGK